MDKFIEIDTRFAENTEKMRRNYADLEKRGFQRWPEEVVLTRTKYNSANAMFETVSVLDPVEEEIKIRERVENNTGKIWESVSMVEIFQQQQKKVVFVLKRKIRQKGAFGVGGESKVVGICKI